MQSPLMLLLILAGFLLETSGDCGTWIPIDPTTIPKAQNTDTIVVYNLICALLECQFDGALTYVNGFHGGIGLFNQNNNNSITVNFDAVPTFLGSVIPQLVYQPNGEVELVFSDYGNVFIYSGINMTFWAYGSVEITTMSGAVFNNFVNWLVEYNSTDRFYDIWSVHTQYPLQPWDQTWIPSHDCFAFVWEALGYLSSQGVTFRVKSDRQSMVALLSPTAPIKMDMSNPIEKAYVVSFYQYLTYQLDNYGVPAVLTVIRELLYEERMIIRTNGTFYMVQPWSPFLDTFFVNLPFPPYD